MSTLKKRTRERSDRMDGDDANERGYLTKRNKIEADALREIDICPYTH